MAKELKKSCNMGAPKGNKFAIGNNGGRPAKYDTLEEMETEINKYFESYLPDEEGNVKPVLGHRPTVTGLALYLGFESRQSLYDYRDTKKEFTCIIKKALACVEMHYEMLLDTKAAAGAIFALKNMNWTDKKELDHTTKGEKIQTITGFKVK